MTLIALFLASLLLGVLLGVFAMLAGVERRPRGSRGKPTPAAAENLLLGHDPARISARFQIPLVAAFASVFGIVGYPLARYSALGGGWQLLIAAGAGAAGATGATLLIAKWALPSARRDAPDERYALQGHFATVTQPIPGQIEPESDAPPVPGAGRPGESGTANAGMVLVEIDGVRQTFPARSLDGAPIPPGTDVVIERIEDGMAIVESWGQVEQRI